MLDSNYVIHNAAFPQFCEKLSTLKSLTSFYFCGHKRTPPLNDANVDLLATTLAALPNLRKLDLSGIELATNVHRVLQGIKNPLKYLSLAHCILDRKDYEWLSGFSGLAECEALGQNN